MKHRKNKATGGGMESASSGTSNYDADVTSKRGSRVKKIMGKVSGDAMHLAGRKARKSGGRAGAEMSPLSSAHKGTPPRGHKGVEID